MKNMKKDKIRTYYSIVYSTFSPSYTSVASTTYRFVATIDVHGVLMVKEHVALWDYLDNYPPQCAQYSMEMKIPAQFCFCDTIKLVYVD